MFTWDEKKRISNLAKHGLDFAAAYRVYEAPGKLTLPSPQNGEDRLIDIALVEVMGVILALVYVAREEDIRVISLRRASRKERKSYEDYHRG